MPFDATLAASRMGSWRGPRQAHRRARSVALGRDVRDSSTPPRAPSTAPTRGDHSCGREAATARRGPLRVGLKRGLLPADVPVGLQGDRLLLVVGPSSVGAEPLALVVEVDLAPAVLDGGRGTDVLDGRADLHV